MPKRKLVAIMFTDIQGFTALMQQDEIAALKIKDKHRRVFEAATAKYLGEIVHYYGDGTLSVFPSAVDAVNCGIDIQQALQEDPKVPLRIGIHLGDIIFSNNDVFGDGVNLASRIESLAVVGSILVSEKLYDEIKNHSSIKTKFLKKFNFKNVRHPIGVHAIANPGLVVPDARDLSGKIEQKRNRKLLIAPLMAILIIVAFIGFKFGSQWGNFEQHPNIKKVMVFPFETVKVTTENNDDATYVISGLTDDFIGELSKVNDLLVINQASTQVVSAGFGTNPFVTDEVGNIDYFIEGSFERNYDQIEIDFTLKNAYGAEASWTNSYSKDISEIRELWSEASKDMAMQMQLDISNDDLILRANLKRVNPETYDLYLKGTHYLHKSTEQDWQRGLVYLLEAIDRNPSDAYAYAGLAEGYISLGHGPAPPPDVFPKALAASQRAIRLDSSLANGWATLAHFHTYFGYDWALADLAFKRADELNPNLAYNHFHRSWYLALFGRMNEAIEEHKKAQELDPFTPIHTTGLGELYRLVGLYDQALAETNKTLHMEDQNGMNLWIKGLILYDQGKISESLATERAAAEINPAWRYIGYGPIAIQAGLPDEGRQVIAELEAMPPTPFGALCLGICYAWLGDYDKAFEWLQFKEKHGWYPWIRVMFLPEKMKKDARFLELIREMKLPDPSALQFDPGAS